jgi:hypothetical protein
MTATLFKFMLFATLLATAVFAVMGWGKNILWRFEKLINELDYIFAGVRFFFKNKVTVNAAIDRKYHNGPAAVCAKCGKFLDRQSSLMAYNLDKAHAYFYCHECYDWTREDKDHIAVYWEVDRKREVIGNVHDNQEMAKGTDNGTKAD